MPDPVLTAAVWDRYEKDRPSHGRELAAWVSKIAEESASPEPTIRRIVADGAGAMLNAVNDRVRTQGQTIADLIGADLVTALDTLREAFTATKKKVLLDKQGRPKLVNADPEGPGFVPENMIYIELPDWQSRLSAVRTAVEIHGARAPQQIEVNQRTVTLDLTSHAALAELERLAAALPRLQAAIAGRAATTARPSGHRATPQIANGDPRRAFLADGMHEDEGRTG